MEQSKSASSKTEHSEAGGEQRVVFRDVPWSFYIATLEANEERRSPRLAYLDGDLEAVVLSPEHEKHISLIVVFLTMITFVWKLDCVNFGATTYKREDVKRGSEPDSSWYFHNAEEMRDKERVDIMVDPAPDLVMEVDITNPSLNKLAIYATFGVVEVWLYQNQVLRILRLDAGSASYAEQSHSHVFPALAAQTVSDFVAIAPTMPRYEWMDRVQEWAEQNRPASP